MPSLTTARPAARNLPYWIAAVLAWLGALAVRPRFNPDEGRYAEIPREMLASGNFVLPRLNDLVYLEKPPLQYWATALVYRLVGVHPWSARLVTAGAALAGVYVVYRAALALWDAPRARAAAAMTGSMLFYVFMGQLLTLDMLLAVELVVAILAFCLAQQVRDTDARTRDRYLLGCWAAMAAATLTKGLIGLVIPGAILVLYTAVARDWRIWLNLALVRGSALYAAIVVPWFVLVERAHAGALWFLIIHEHFERYLTKVHARYQPAWYFVPILLAGVLPWLPQILRALAVGWRASVPRGQFDAPRLLWLSAVLIFAFFSASDSKLAPYILPVLPLLALLGSAPGAGARFDLKLSAALSVLIGVVLAGALVVYPRMTSNLRNLALLESAGPWLAAASAAVLVAGIATLRAGSDWDAGVRRLALGHFAAALLLASGGAASLAWKYSGSVVLPELAAGLRDADPATPIYAFRTYDWTLPVYTGRTLIPVQWRGELDYGLNFEPAKGIGELTDFEQRWNAATQAFAIVEPGEMAAFRATGLPFRELKVGSELVLLSRR